VSMPSAQTHLSGWPSRRSLFISEKRRKDFMTKQIEITKQRVKVN